jgi:hypothetical protein
MQSPPDSWAHWLYTNAPAAWLSALIAILTCIVLLRSRKRPKRLVVREVASSSLVRVWPGVRRKIKISFDDKPITTLGQVDYEMFNEGSEVIQNPKLTLALPPQSVVLDVLLKPEESGAELKIDTNRVSIYLPYMNPVREHRQTLSLSVLVDGDPSEVKITGAGEGWSVRHRPLPTRKQEFLRTLSLSLFGLVWAGVAYKYGGYVQARYGIAKSEVSWRAFVSTMPVLIPALIWVGVLMWDLSSSVRRTSGNRSSRREPRR